MMGSVRIESKKVKLGELARAYAGKAVYEQFPGRMHVVLEMGKQTVDYLDVYMDLPGAEVEVIRCITSRIQWDLDVVAGVIRLRAGEPGHESCNSTDGDDLDYA